MSADQAITFLRSLPPRDDAELRGAAHAAFNVLDEIGAEELTALTEVVARAIATSASIEATRREIENVHRGRAGGRS